MTTKQLRERFDKWAKRYCFSVNNCTHYPFLYIEYDTECAWAGYRAGFRQAMKQKKGQKR